MLIKNASVFLGKNLDYVSNTSIKINNQKFFEIKSNIQSNTKDKTIDCEGLLVLPGFVNCHTHIGDSIAKDFTLDSSVDKKIHPVFGIKSKILKQTNEKLLGNFMENTCKSMIKKGITSFVDFREGGINGVLLIKKILKKTPIRGFILGRIEYYQNTKEIQKNLLLSNDKKKLLSDLLKKSDGIGVSGANENSISSLNFLAKSQKIRAIHASETKESVTKSKKNYGKTETIRALNLKPHFLVHMTHASKSDLKFASKKTRGIVVCPRANAALAEGIPDIELMMKAGCTLALGTDNVMVNSPDMFREMDYLWKISMALHKHRIEPKEILKMATTNAEKILQKNIGIIEKGKFADCIFIDKHDVDLEPMHDPYAAVVHRASQSSIRAVMIGGKIVFGKI